MILKLLINNVDMSSLIIERDYFISMFDGSIIDSLEIDLEDLNANVTVIEGLDLIIENAADSTDRLFAGIIVDVQEESIGLGRIIKIIASDWKMLTDRAYFTLQFDNKTDRVIIQNAFVESGITEINTSDLVQSARTLDKLVFRGSSLRQMLDTVTEITGWFWDIDKFKKLIYRPYGNSPLAFTFTDNIPNGATTFPYYNFRRNKEIGQFNEIEVHGSKRLSAITNQTYSGNASRKRFTLSLDNTISTNDYPYIYRGPEGSDPDIPAIDRNTGTNSSPIWTVQSVGIEGQDSGKDVVWSVGSTQVLWTVAPPNFSTNSWRITGRGFVKASHIARDEPAIKKAGRVFKKVLVISEIEDNNQAIDVAEAFLREQGPKTYLSMTVNKDGIKVGDSVMVTNTPLGITATIFHVSEMTMRGLGGELYEYGLVMRNAP